MWEQGYLGTQQMAGAFQLLRSNDLVWSRALKTYLVGERGPELFVPASAGRVEANAGTDTSRDVKVSIAIAAPRGTTAPVAMQRSARQVASAVRRALGS